MEREVLKLTVAQARTILHEGYYDDEDGKEIEFSTILNEPTDQGRWHTNYDLIVKRESDGKFFKSYYSVGSTEEQFHYAYDHDDPEFFEVFPATKTVTVYQ